MADYFIYPTSDLLRRLGLLKQGVTIFTITYYIKDLNAEKNSRIIGVLVGNGLVPRALFYICYVILLYVFYVHTKSNLPYIRKVRK